MGCVGAAILRTRALPAWTGYVFLTATVLLLGQYAAFRARCRSLEFLAFLALGIAALVRRAPAGRRPAANRANRPSTTHRQ